MYGSQSSNDIYKYIELAEDAYSENLLGAAYMYAAQARAMAEAFLDILGMSAEHLRDKVAYLKGIAISQINEITKKNITPILSVSYLEYSHYFLQKGDYSQAIGFIKLSHTWSEMYLTFGETFNTSINITIPSELPTSQNESSYNNTTSSDEEHTIDSRIILVTVLMFVVFIATFYYITRR